MNVFVRIRYNQALRLVPCSNCLNAANAFTNVSCTRSCASAGLRVIRNAAAYNWSMKGRACSSKSRPRSWVSVVITGQSSCDS